MIEAIVIGACECTGLVAPMLGGGHDFLKGRYGLLADNLISANMVLANGSAITVSESQHPDLFWAIRGAGHNFGVVTSFQYKIYDRAPENELWAYDSMVVSIDKLETVYEEAEKQRQGAPVELGHWGSTLVLPDVDPKVVSYLEYSWPGVVADRPVAFIALYRVLSRLGTAIKVQRSIP